MPKDAPRNHRHHKNRNAYRAKQTHGDGQPISEEGGLRLSQTDYAPIPGIPRINYPKGWTFGQVTPGRAVLLVFGGFFVLILLIAALAKLLAG